MDKSLPPTYYLSIMASERATRGLRTFHFNSVSASQPASQVQTLPEGDYP